MRFQVLRWIVFVVLSCGALIGCVGGAVSPGSSTPALKPTPTLHIVSPTATGSGDTSPIPTATLVPPSPAPTEPPSSGPTPLPPPVPKPDYGVQIHLFAGDMAETLDWARGLGVGWVKQQVMWHTIEHGPDNFEWEQLDRAVGACEAFGFKLLLSVIRAPDWTRAVELITYEQGVEPFRITDRLSDSDRAMLMGGALAQIYDWAPEDA